MSVQIFYFSLHLSGPVKILFTLLRVWYDCLRRFTLTFISVFYFFLIQIFFLIFSYREKSFGIEDRNLNHGPRWRSDETSDEEEEQSPQKAIDITHHTPTSTTRGVRRSRFSKR